MIPAAFRRAGPSIGHGLVATAAVTVAFAVLASLVAAGSLSAIDQYAVDHWMPNFEPGGGSTSTISAHQLYPHLGSPLQAACNIWTFPASAPISGVLLVACCLALARRRRRRAAIVWATTWFVANAVEILGKSVLHRPELHAVEAGVRVSFDSFAHSFPSGHALRAVLIAALLPTVWPRAGRPALLWALVALPALVLNAAHTPSDVLGGMLLAVLAVLGAHVCLRERAPVR